MNITRVQMPDGTLLTIEAADSKETAAIISNKLGINPAQNVTQQTATPAAPVLSAQVQDFLRSMRPAADASDAEPLALPVMSFSRS